MYAQSTKLLRKFRLSKKQKEKFIFAIRARQKRGKKGEWTSFVPCSNFPCTLPTPENPTVSQKCIYFKHTNAYYFVNEFPKNLSSAKTKSWEKKNSLLCFFSLLIFLSHLKKLFHSEILTLIVDVTSFNHFPSLSFFSISLQNLQVMHL